MTEPLDAPDHGQWTPVYPGWTPCEDRADPSAWVDVSDSPFDGEYHDPEASHDAN